MPLRVLRFFLGDPLLFLRYISVGAVSAAVEFALFGIAYEWLAWPLMAANGFALGCALALNFTLQMRWTFRADGGWGRRLRGYALMQAVSAVLNTALMWLMVAHWGWYAPLAKVLEIGIVFAWNFTFSKLVVFAASPVDPSAGRALERAVDRSVDATLDAQHRAAAGDALDDPRRHGEREHER